MKFEPIAIIGRSCLFPGALNPGELTDLVLSGRDALSRVPEGYWGIDPACVMTDPSRPAPNKTWCDRGGYVRGFEEIFDPEGFAVPKRDILEYDPLVHWLLHTAREALRDGGCCGTGLKTGLIAGNLSYPSHGLVDFAESVWLGEREDLRPAFRERAAAVRARPGNRFMSGHPAHIAARALGLDGGAFALDAACASSLYAVKLACDRLHDRTADVMLAGGINRADDLIIHIGFCLLMAMSRSGQSRPFHRDADGLVPAEGAGFVALKRLDDAVSAGDAIHGVIRGIGLAGDGRGRGLLVPCEEGQVAAMRRAYEVSGISPERVSMIECHATGTAVGDVVELRSMARIFSGSGTVPIGSIKSNLGHPITASGVAGLIKILGAMKARVLPRTLNAEIPLAEFAGSPFRLLTDNEPWESDGPRVAGLSNFGFGGNNAHLVVEEWEERPPNPPRGGQSNHSSIEPPLDTFVDPPIPPEGGLKSFIEPGIESPPPGDLGGGLNRYSHDRKVFEDSAIAIIGIGIIAGAAVGREAFSRALFSGSSQIRTGDNGVTGARAGEIELPLLGLHFPPADLAQTLPQQLALLAAALEAFRDVKNPYPGSTALFAGMGCDAEVARGALSWKLEQLVRDRTGSDDVSAYREWMDRAREGINSFDTAAAVLGAMPNIVANRVSNQLDIRGPSFSISSEELSGIRALELAVRSLGSGEADAALACAVDFCCEPVHAAAARALLPEDRHVPGDAAVCLILKRASDARRDDDTVYALIGAGKKSIPGITMGYGADRIRLEPLFGHSHAASGLLYVAAAALSCHHRAVPAGAGETAQPRLGRDDPLTVEVSIDALGGESARIYLIEEKRSAAAPLFLTPAHDIRIFSGADRHEVLRGLRAGEESAAGPARLVIVSTDYESFMERKDRAAALLEKGSIIGAGPGGGIYFRERPVSGGIAFVFAGAAGSYRGMGREPALAFPDLVERVRGGLGPLLERAPFLFESGRGDTPDPEEMLWAGTILTQIHAAVSRELLGLSPAAAIGYSSGESNSLFALGAWGDMAAMAREFHDRGVFTRHLGGEFAVLKKAWAGQGVTEARWSNWLVRAAAGEARDALRSEPLAHVIIVNSPGEIVIGGHDGACERVIARMGGKGAVRLPYPVACHCPELALYAGEWRELHRRKTAAVPGVRFYSAAREGHYAPTADSAAESLLGMGTRTLDFPRMIEDAYRDGARIFVEHGPRDSCSRWIRDILKERDHVAVSLDSGGVSSTLQLVRAAAQLAAAGVAVDLGGLVRPGVLRKSSIGKIFASKEAPSPLMGEGRGGGVGEEHSVSTNHPPLTPPIKGGGLETGDGTGSSRVLTPMNRYPAHPAPVTIPPLIMMDTRERERFPVTDAEGYEAMAPPPRLCPVMDDPPGTAPAADGGAHASPPAFDSSLMRKIRESHAAVASAHREFLEKSGTLHREFLRHRENALLLAAASMDGALPAVGAYVMPVSSDQKDIAAPSVMSDTVAAADYAYRAKPEKRTDTARQGRAGEAPHGAAISAADALKNLFREPEWLEPKGPRFSRRQLEVIASGKISDVFGPLFARQDGYELQVRLPEGPLLLADRVLGIEAEPGSMGKGTLWSETDITEDAWYLHDRYMPGGITIEAGQCDLTLISYLGIDFLNRGERAYRLLGCDLMYFGRPARAGDTLSYQIRIDGHAAQGDTRIFFFRCDCRVGGERIMSVRNGQAGFFTRDQLARAGGVIWDPATAERTPDDRARVDPPFVECAYDAFSRERVLALSEGRAYDCFGPGFENCASHTNTPRLPAGKMLLIQEITRFDPRGGPWGRGYIRAENDISPDDWFLHGHFKNDPCMPGTLMSDACMQVAAFYLGAMGYAIERDGWRIEPVTDEVFSARCRGQVTPSSKKLVYEAFIDEFIASPYPTVYADILATADGLKCLHIKRLGVRLVPDYPLDKLPGSLKNFADPKPVAAADGFTFGYASLIACALGRPSDAFGPRGAVFEKGRHISRLPAPPYHFMSRLTRIDATMGALKSAGESVEAEYDIPPDAWYFDENGNRSMPFCVLMETALQPCGWLAVFEGGVDVSPEPLLFRNLDGTAVQHREVFPGTGTIRTRATLTNIARLKGVALFNFDVSCRAGDDLVYTMKTGFGFFLKSAFEQQFGLPMTEEQKQEAARNIREPSDFRVVLTERPGRYCGGEPRLPGRMLLMLDRVTGYWPRGGERGRGRLRAEKDVNVYEWFFKSHFYQDPVQPGSLGVEALIQLLQFYMIHENMGEGIERPRFEAHATGKSVAWKYRGQAVPKNKLITTELEIEDTGLDDRGPFARGRGWLWVDGLRVYRVDDLCMRIVPGGSIVEADTGGEGGSIDTDAAAGAPGAGPIGAQGVIGQIASQIDTLPADIRLDPGGEAFRCATMPLSVFPLEIVRGRDGNERAVAGEPVFDLERLARYGHHVLGRVPGVIEDLSRELFVRFVRTLVVGDPAAFESVRRRNLLYLANHQVQIESVLFPGLAHYLNDTRVVSIAGGEHRNGWIGSLTGLVTEYPLIRYPENIIYFEKNDRESMFDIIRDLKAMIAGEGISVFVHVEGRLGLRCREPVSALSSVFLDLALELDLPVVPVRFAGGLPVEAMERTLDFPFGYCRQEYHIGRPIMPDELRSLPYAGRRRMVMAAINATGPAVETELPGAPDRDFADGVRRWIDETGVPEARAVFYRALENACGPVSDETRAVIRLAREGAAIDAGDEQGRWLGRFASWLLRKDRPADTAR